MPNGVAVDPKQVAAQLGRVASSKTFSGSARLLSFLRYTVRESLSGNAARVKEYTVGVEVYGRGEDFNPKADSIVRTEAIRLREKLRRYYTSEGRKDPILIRYPKGGYLPEIVLRRSARSRGHLIIAVLPFANSSGAPEDEFFCDGLTDELISTLATIPAVRVIARTSVFQFKGKAMDVRQVGRKLGATAILEGSVRSHQGQLRVSARFIDVSTGAHLRSLGVERDGTDMFALQDEITRAIVSALPQTRETFVPQTIVDPEAHRSYLKGRYCFHQWTVSEIQRSIGWFQDALRRDPIYARAWAGLGDSYSILTHLGVDPAQHAALARKTLERALKLDANLTHAAAAYAAIVALDDWQWKAAEQRFRDAILSQPGVAETHHLFAISCLIPQARLQEAAGCIQRTLELDPLFLGAHTDLGRVFYLMGDFEEAIAQQLRTLEMDSNFREAHWQLALAYEQRNNFAKAMASFGRALSLSEGSGNVWGSLGHCYAKWGKAEEARNCLARLDSTPAGIIGRALISTALGEIEIALDHLEQLLPIRSRYLLMLKTDPRFAPLSGNGRHTRLLARLGLS